MSASKLTFGTELLSNCFRKILPCLCVSCLKCESLNYTSLIYFGFVFFWIQQKSTQTIFISDVLNVGVRFCSTETLDWFEETMGASSMDSLVKSSGFVLYSACMNGSYQTIKWAVTTLEKYSSLQKELDQIYDSWDSWNRMQFTLLFFLCYMNMEDPRPIRLFQEKGFSPELLCHKFGGRDALEISVYHNNLEAVKALLKNPIWVREFLPVENGVEKILRSSQSQEVEDVVERRFNEAWEMERFSCKIRSKGKNPRE